MQGYGPDTHQKALSRIPDTLMLRHLVMKLIHGVSPLPRANMFTLTEIYSQLRQQRYIGLVLRVAQCAMQAS